jgi:hypothetical protein
MNRSVSAQFNYRRVMMRANEKLPPEADVRWTPMYANEPTHPPERAYEPLWAFTAADDAGAPDVPQSNYWAFVAHRGFIATSFNDLTRNGQCSGQGGLCYLFSSRHTQHQTRRVCHGMQL